MLLTFSREFPWGKLTGFKQKMQTGIKKHTFRLGYRFEPGDPLHFWGGAPRANRFQHSHAMLPFNIPITKRELWLLAPMQKPIFLTAGSGDIEIHDLALPCVTATEKFEILFIDAPGFEGLADNYLVSLKIEGISINNKLQLTQIAKNDGFDNYEEFIEYFNYRRKKDKTKLLEGQIVHWTKLTYTNFANVYKP